MFTGFLKFSCSVSVRCSGRTILCVWGHKFFSQQSSSAIGQVARTWLPQPIRRGSMLCCLCCPSP
uniref:Uncharacterized protein n=1 Tax=Anguilla anguilla TaxID=7936 RepID=A0A0E9WB77_ANGAN